MAVYLVRHARAGEKRSGTRPDELRPLSRVGHRQADALVRLLRDDKITALVSSPALRCVQTLEPLATATGLPIEPERALEVAGSVDGALAVVRSSDDGTALCTHGEVLRALLDRLARDDGSVFGDDPPCAKGSVWVLDIERGAVRDASYRDAPR